MKLYFLLIVFFIVQANANQIVFKKSYREKNKQAEEFLKSTYPELTQINGYKATHFTPHGKVYKWQYPDEMIQDDLIGFKHTPSVEIRHIQRTDTELVYDVIYTFDEFSRRVTPINKSTQTKKFITLLGCSFTYGNGLNDNETLNYYLAQQTKEYYPYNYGIGASGVNVNLALVENTDFKKQITEKQGAFVYVFMLGHVPRLSISWPYVSWNGHSPYYEWNDDKSDLVRKGFLESENPWSYWILNLIGKYFGQNILNNRDFPATGLKHIELSCEMLYKIKKKLHQEYPGSPFIVYSTLGPLDADLKECLNRKRVNVYEAAFMSDPRYNSKIDYTIKYDGHPNAEKNKLLSTDILKAVQKFELMP